MSREVVAALHSFDTDDNIGAIVIAGSPRAFAAGADIEEMADKTLVELQQHDVFAAWSQLPTISKPIIAAVSGYALGGRLRAGDDVRLHHRFRRRAVRPTGNQTGHPAWNRRLATPHPIGWQGAGDGHDPHRSHHPRIRPMSSIRRIKE
jgi:hypothetical protein